MAETQNKAGFVAKRIGNVTLPLMKLVQDKEYYVRFTSAIHLGKEIAGQVKVDPTTGEVTGKQEPAHIAFVDNLENEEPVQIIISTVMRKEMQEAFPDDGYVGKCFQFALMRSPNGKRYHVPQIFEIEDPHPEKGEAARKTFEAKRAASAPATDKAGENEAAATDKPAPKAKK